MSIKKEEKIFLKEMRVCDETLEIIYSSKYMLREPGHHERNKKELYDPRE
jgi:hypothetical protein